MDVFLANASFLEIRDVLDFLKKYAEKERGKYLRLCNFLSSSVKLKTGRVFHEIARRCFASCVIRAAAGRFSISSRSKVRSFDLATRSITPLIRQIAFSAGMHGCETSAQYLQPSRSQHLSRTRALYRAATVSPVEG